MQAVVSALDAASAAQIESIWDDLKERFGAGPGVDVPVPHFSYHAADRYDWMRLRDALFHVAQDHAPFRVHAGGLGMFTGTKRVVHVPVVRNRAVNALQRDLWRDLEGVGSGTVQHFHPELWIPHVTLARQGLTDEVLPELLRWLAERSFSLEFRVEAIGVLDERGTGVTHRFPLGRRGLRVSAA